MRHEKDKHIAELQKRGKYDMDLDSTSQQTAQDLKDAWKEEFAKTQLGSRITQADRQNDTKSLNRQLEENLVLLVEQQMGDKGHLLLPQGKREEGETLRQTAERVLRKTCGDKVNVQFYGNAPCGFYKYKYPVSQREDAVGAKVFFFRSIYRTGQVDEKVSSKFEWLNKTDLQTKLKGSYAESVSQFLL